MIGERAASSLLVASGQLGQQQAGGPEIDRHVVSREQERAAAVAPAIHPRPEHPVRQVEGAVRLGADGVAQSLLVEIAGVDGLEVDRPRRDSLPRHAVAQEHRRAQGGVAIEQPLTGGAQRLGIGGADDARRHPHVVGRTLRCQ